MNERNIKLVEAAQNVFSRYGYGKSTMNDIAREAGVARATLYNAYASKEDMLRAAVRHHADTTRIDVMQAWEQLDTFDAKLDVFFDLVPLKWYDMAQTMPDSAELIEGMHAIAHEEIFAIASDWTTRFETLVLDHAKPGSPAHDNAKALGDFIYSAGMNAKIGVADRAELQSRLVMLKLSVRAMLEP
jgi:AcrR family transcriptional regulator